MFKIIPPGFFSANEILNSLPTAVSSHLINKTFDIIRNQAGSVSVEKYVQLAGDVLQSVDGDPTDIIQSAINAVEFIFMNAMTVKPKGSEFGQALAQQTDIKKELISIFDIAWQTHLEGGEDIDTTATSTTLKALRLGQLVGIDWKLGIGISSSHCKNLHAPFVSMVVKVADPTGHINSSYMELTLNEFNEFAKTFRDISQQLDTV